MAEGAKGGVADPRAAPERWIAKIKEQWRATKKHAETYPYVWGSYIVVYGGLGVYAVYKWRKLRRTEDRVRVLQEELKKLVEAEELAAQSSAAGTSSSSVSAVGKMADGSGKK